MVTHWVNRTVDDVGTSLRSVQVGCAYAIGRFLFGGPLDMGAALPLLDPNSIGDGLCAQERGLEDNGITVTP
jgi:hypothetical protein